MNAFWITVVALAVTTALIKGAGPVLLGGRDLPPRFAGVVVLMAPALLTALIVTSTFADGDRWQVGAVTVGVGAGAVVAWRGASAIAVVATAVVVTAVLRALGLP